MPHVSRRSTFVFASMCTLAIVGCAAAQPPAVADIDLRPERGEGRMTDGTGNPVNFTPRSTFETVDAETVDLRQVFVDLGPIARLWYQHVQTLANPFFEGRVPGTRGKQIASEYVEFYFKQYGLEPAFPANGNMETPGGELADAGAWISYRQPFEYNMPGARMRVQVRDEKFAINGQQLESGTDYTVLGVSGSGTVTAPVAFVGYGIVEGEDGYTSFDADTDLSGRIAMVFRYEPLDEQGNSRWGERGFSSHSAIVDKFRSLRDRNAAGIILVNPPDATGGARGLETIGRSSRFGPPMTIPVMQVTQEVAERILRTGDSQPKSLLTWRHLADSNGVRTVEMDRNVRITMACDVSRGGARMGVEAENVGAVLHGKGNLANQWLVIGAHYDHVGYGEFGTSPQYRGRLHPGADDNASGTAGLLILAKSLSEAYARAGDDANLRSVLFIAFSAEESGLHGSRAFVNNATMSHDSISAMLNMDMIGRVRDNQVVILGAATAEGLEDILKPHVRRSGLTAATYPGGSGRSDDANFLNNNIPAVHFFSGMHPEYHAPMDEAYTMNPAGARDILMLIHDVAMDLAARPDQLVYTTPRRVATRDRGYGNVRLGIRPGMGEELERGILIDDVSLGTSADDAGIKKGDIMLTWNGDDLTMATLAEKLRAHAPGDVVLVTVQRDNEVIDIEVTLKASEG